MPITDFFKRLMDMATQKTQGADIVEDIPPNKGTDTSLSYNPVDKSFSEKLAECSFTSTVSQRTSDSSFRSAVSRLKTADDTDTTADFESAGEEDFSGLEQQRFPPDCGSSDLWFQSLEYYNGTTTPVVNSGGRGITGDVTLSPELNTRDYDYNDITLRPNSAESSPRSTLDRTDISTAEQAPISSFGSSTPIKSPCHTTDVIDEPSKIILESPSNVTVNLLPQLNCDTQPACDKIHLVESSIKPIISSPILNELDNSIEEITNKSHELNTENSQSHKTNEFLNNSNHSSINNSVSSHYSQSEKSNFQCVTNSNETSVINNSSIIDSSLSIVTNTVQNLDNKQSDLVDNQLDDLIGQLSGLNIKNNSLIINDNQINTRDCSIDEKVNSKNSFNDIDLNINNKQDSFCANENCNEQDISPNVNGSSSIYLNNCEEISEDTKSVYQEVNIESVGSNLISEFENPVSICLQDSEPKVNLVTNEKEQLNSLCGDIDLTLDKSLINDVNVPGTITKPEFIKVPSIDISIVPEEDLAVVENISNVNEFNCSEVQNENVSEIKSETSDLSSVINEELLEVNKVESVTRGIDTTIKIEIQENKDILLVHEGSDTAFNTEDSPTKTTIVEGEISTSADAAAEAGVHIFDFSISPTKVEALESNDAGREVKLVDINFSFTEDQVLTTEDTEIEDEKNNADEKVDISNAGIGLTEIEIKLAGDSISVANDKVAEIQIASLEELKLLEVVAETEVEAEGIKLVAEEYVELLKVSPLSAEAVEVENEVVGIKEVISSFTIPDKEIVEVETKSTDVEELEVLVETKSTDVDELEVLVETKSTDVEELGVLECNKSGLSWILGNSQNEQLFEGSVVSSAKSVQSNLDPFLMLDDVETVVMDSSETHLNVIENTVHDKSDIETKKPSNIGLKKQNVKLLEEKTVDLVKTDLSFDETFLTAGDNSLTDPPAEIGMDSLIGNFQGLDIHDVSNRSVTMNKENDVSTRVENPEHDGDNLSDISSTGSPPDLLNNMTEEEMADLLCTSQQHLSHGAGGDLLNLSFNNLRSYHPPDSTFLDMKPLDLNTTEAGPVTASDDVQAGELNQVISEADMDIATLKRRVGESDQNNESLLNNFDPLTDLSVNSVDNQHNDSFFGTLKERVEVVETTPIKDHHVGLLVPVTPLPGSQSHPSPVTPQTMRGDAGSLTPSEGRITDTVRSPMQEALAKELSKLQDAMMERQRVHEMKLMEMKMKVQEAEKKREMKLARLKELEARQPLRAKVKTLTANNTRLKEENSTLRKRTVELLGVLDEYEKALPRLLNQREAKKKVMMDEVRSLVAERNTAQQHVANMETALNDTHQKYERSVKSIEDYKLGQDKKVINLIERCNTIETAKEKYSKLLAHATQRLEDTNSDRNTMLRSHESEVARTEALIQQRELKIRSNNVTIEQQQKELKEMTEIHDELLRKLN